MKAENEKHTELLRRCAKGDRKAQKELYERHGPVMKMVCLRYLFEKQEAEAVMNRGFFKVFTKLKEFRGNGSFEGWVRRIMVNECLNENRKSKSRLTFTTDLAAEERFSKETPEVASHHDLDFLLRVIGSLPEGYRIVFNLNEIDGYNHKEIAEKLDITESASRSQLARAKKLLREKLKDINEL